MKKSIFIIISIILVVAMVLPFVNIQNIGEQNAQMEEAENVFESQNSYNFSLPIEQVIPERCPISASYKEDWQTVTCETFDEGTGLWTGEEAGLSIEVRNGKYSIDSTKGEDQIESIGYSFPVLVGIARDLMLSITGAMDCQEGDCAWGVFVRSTTEAIVYVFLVHNDGSYSLTGLSPQESNQNLGNIQAAANTIINKNGENTIVAITEGSQMMFFVNGVLLATHEAYDATNPSYGVMLWGSPGTRAYTELDDILARAN